MQGMEPSSLRDYCCTCNRTWRCSLGIWLFAMHAFPHSHTHPGGAGIEIISSENSCDAFKGPVFDRLLPSYGLKSHQAPPVAYRLSFQNKDILLPLYVSHLIDSFSAESYFHYKLGATSLTFIRWELEKKEKRKEENKILFHVLTWTLGVILSVQLERKKAHPTRGQACFPVGCHHPLWRVWRREEETINTQRRSAFPF